MLKRWRDVEVGDRFADGSVVTQVHNVVTADTYRVRYKKPGLFGKHGSVTVSADHLFLCDLSKLKEETKAYLMELLDQVYIPVEANVVVKYEVELTDSKVAELYDYLTKGLETKEDKDYSDLKYVIQNSDVTYEEVEAHAAIEDEDHAWLSAEIIDFLVKRGEVVKIGENTVTSTVYTGKKECRCISTDTGRYVTDGLIHHNSVTLRNIIFHSITHNEDISIGLIDLKLTEFTQFKDMKGVVAVANTVQEAVELLRVAREVMYKRNAEMAKHGITDFVDYKPKEPTDKISIFGRHFHEDQSFKVKVDGEEKEMTAKEILEYLHSK